MLMGCFKNLFKKTIRAVTGAEKEHGSFRLAFRTPDMKETKYLYLKEKMCYDLMVKLKGEDPMIEAVVEEKQEGGEWI